MRPKTMKTKLLQGTVAPSRIKTFSGSAVGGSLLELSDAEQAIYKKLQDHLLLHNAGKEIDDIFLTISARAIGHLVYNAEVLAGSGAVMIHPNGARQVSAEWTAFKQSMEMFMDLSRSLGLDPGSRLKLDYFRDNTAEQDDEIAKLLKLA
jgi:phage terminase small subunit